MDKITGRLKPKSKDQIKEAADIIINSDNDEAAIQFLRETLDDDFPDLELGSMDLHEATKILGTDEDKARHSEDIGDLNQAFDSFMKESKKGTRKNKKRKRRRKK